jgi:hypothetical protein
MASAPIPLHPRRGTHAPIAGTPLRAPGSARRTSTIDSSRPEGLAAPMQFRARARDLVTEFDGTGRVHDEWSLNVTLAPDPSAPILAITSDPPYPPLDALRGLSVRRGFRAAAGEALPADFAAHTLLATLLDDLPGSLVVSGYAAGRMGQFDEVSPELQAKMARQADICAGWQSGGTLMIDISRGLPPPTVTGPSAEALTRSDDPLGWHHLEPLGPHAMRRARRTDVLAGSPAPVDAYFRDSHLDEDGRHTSIHEYSVAATLGTDELEDIEAVSHALPWVECPSAVASAKRLIGTPVHDLRARVRREFVGTTTCTHLNDMLRSLEDLEALVELRPTR